MLNETRTRLSEGNMVSEMRLALKWLLLSELYSSSFSYSLLVIAIEACSDLAAEFR